MTCLADTVLYSVVLHKEAISLLLYGKVNQEGLEQVGIKFNTRSYSISVRLSGMSAFRRSNDSIGKPSMVHDVYLLCFMAMTHPPLPLTIGYKSPHTCIYAIVCTCVSTPY